MKGERRFIATIARRLDSLGAITRGQRDSQTAMGGSDAALFRESDNLESPYAKAALRQFYSALWRGSIEGWTVERFQDSTGLKIVHEGGLKDDLPPMPKFLNRLLALPHREQNQLFAELEARIAANIEQAIEAGSYEVGVETVTADSLVIAGRETLYEHPGTPALRPSWSRSSGATRWIRPTPMHALASRYALSRTDGKPRLVFNARSKRAAVLLPAPLRACSRTAGCRSASAGPARQRRRAHGGRPSSTPPTGGAPTRRPLARALEPRDRRPAGHRGVALLARHRPAAAGLGPTAGREHAGAAPDVG